jgi:hypothetical protein
MRAEAKFQTKEGSPYLPVTIEVADDLGLDGLTDALVALMGRAVIEPGVSLLLNGPQMSGWKEEEIEPKGIRAYVYHHTSPDSLFAVTTVQAGEEAFSEMLECLRLSMKQYSETGVNVLVNGKLVPFNEYRKTLPTEDG